MSEFIETETCASVRILRLNRPEALNALNEGMFIRLREEIAAAGQDPAVRAVLICARGRAFSVGADLKDPMMGFHLPPEARGDACRATLGGLMNALILEIAQSPRPVITAINGTCAGGAVGLALAGDVTIAGEGAKIMLGFVPLLALTPDLGATWQLVRKLGPARAMGLMLSGEPILAGQAAQWGLIWKTTPDDTLEEVALRLAQQIAAGPHEAQMRLRALVRHALVNDLETQLAAECEAQASRSNSPEVAEAISAFMAKIPPDFSKIPPHP